MSSQGLPQFEKLESKAENYWTISEGCQVKVTNQRQVLLFKAVS
jgi:hypothetical protein